MDSPKFESFQRVRVRVVNEKETPGSPIPEEHLMGKTGIVETSGRVYGSDPADKRNPSSAYFVRIEGLGPVLVGEDWLEDAPPEE